MKPNLQDVSILLCLFSIADCNYGKFKGLPALCSMLEGEHNGKSDSPVETFSSSFHRYPNTF